MRLDHCLVKKTGRPRHQVQKMIAAGNVTVNGRRVTKPAFDVTGNEAIEIVWLPPETPGEVFPEPLPLELLYEDDALAVLNKPAGRVVHPACGHPSGTLVNALLHRYGILPEGSDPLKPGIVHRLDRGTSGCLAVARTPEALRNLQQQFKNREVRKTYLALVAGWPPAEGRVDRPIGRHPKKRQRISVHTRKGREAVTLWRVRERFSLKRAGGDSEKWSWVEIDLKTGRTHQIRVHFAAMGHPVVGDPVYGRARKRNALREWISRPALHAWKLELAHPLSGNKMEFEAPLPEDLENLLRRLQEGAC